jgi:hypothetical protein
LRAAGAAPAPGPAALVGIQIAGHSLLDEGIDRCLDLVQSTARANALFLYSHSHYAAHNRPPSVYADHGVPIRDERKRKITRVWLRHHDARFAATSLRYLPPGPDEEYGDRDLFAELAPVCRARGLKLFARILEPGAAELRGRVRHAERAMSVDLDGKPSAQPCRNNPEWLEFWDATVDDTVRSYPLDGYQWGAERVGPLSDLLWRGAKPFCFCAHCEARARREGIDPTRARRGFERLHALVGGWHGGGALPPEGAFTHVLRVLMQFPEVLAWDYQWRLALEEQGRRRARRRSWAGTLTTRTPRGTRCSPRSSATPTSCPTPTSSSRSSTTIFSGRGCVGGIWSVCGRGLWPNCRRSRRSDSSIPCAATTRRSRRPMPSWIGAASAPTTSPRKPGASSPR